MTFDSTILISPCGPYSLLFFGDENACLVDVLHNHAASHFTFDRLDFYLCIGYVYSTAEVTQRCARVLDILTRAPFAMQLFQQRSMPEKSVRKGRCVSL